MVEKGQALYTLFNKKVKGLGIFRIILPALNPAFVALMRVGRRRYKMEFTCHPSSFLKEWNLIRRYSGTCSLDNRLPMPSMDESVRFATTRQPKILLTVPTIVRGSA
jgi:hypothetical protein